MTINNDEPATTIMSLSDQNTKTVGDVLWRRFEEARKHYSQMRYECFASHDVGNRLQCLECEEATDWLNHAALALLKRDQNWHKP